MTGEVKVNETSRTISTSTPQFFRPEVDTWWKNVLKSPKHVVAPMVDASELPWRLLSRKYNADLCFTPMIHSKNFIKDMKYRKDNLSSLHCMEDRPLIVQFCGNDPAILAQAAIIVKDHCDGVDINLGCPQTIAKRGHYGAFLQNEWDILERIVKKVTEQNIPVSCKIRIFPEIEKTVRYAKMLEASGCWMLTVHGRTITQKGPLTGLACWDYVKAVKEAVHVPVISNGNIQYLSDVEKCLEETRVDGVMSAEGNLHNPALFSGIQPSVWDMAIEYLELVNVHPCPLSYTRGHLFKLFQHLMVLDENIDLRESLARAMSVSNFKNVTLAVKERYEQRFHVEDALCPIKTAITLPFPPWICQPYERPPPTSNTEQNSIKAESLNSQFECREGESRKRLKRMKRNPHKDWDAVRVPMTLCSNCVNPTGPKCDCCKNCCRERCYRDGIKCDSHKIFGRSDAKKDDELNSISENQTVPSPVIVL